MTRKKLTALIPAHNDDYALDFCLRSIVEHFDEIVVLDDCSTDRTADILADAGGRHAHVTALHHSGDRGLGWIEARNRLMAETDSDWLFFLDSDDVLCEYNAHLLRQIAEASECPGAAPVVRLQLCELWGDFNHTTGRLRHYDRCHVFYNRSRLANGHWGGGTAACFRPVISMHPARSDGPLLFHIKGVKPDRRLVERAFTRRWLGAGRPGRLDDFAGLAAMSPEEIHARALRILLHSKQDHIRKGWGPGMERMGPVRPKLIRSRTFDRFEIVYTGPEPSDRIDHGWPLGPVAERRAAA